MKKYKFTNITEFNKNFYNYIGIFNCLRTDKVGIIISLIALIIIIFVSLFTNIEFTKTTKITMIICFIVFPIVFFGFPYLLVIKKYIKANEQSYPEIYTVISEFDDHGFYCKNNVGRKAIFSYKDITSIIENKKLICIKTNKSKQPLYLSKDGFDNSYTNFIEYLEKKLKK